MRILALDQGTTSTRLLAAEGSGLQVLGQMRHRTSYPFPGWVEQNAAEILANCQTLLAKCRDRRCHSTGQSGRKLSCLGCGDERAAEPDHRLAGPAHFG